MSRRLLVISGGLSQPSSTRLLADRLTASTVAALGGQGADAEVTVVELRDLAHDITNAVLTGFAAPDLQTVLDAVRTVDGVIAVTPTFNASYSGLFKSFFDVLEQDSLTGVPVLVAATGGTERHSLVLDHALRPLFSYLGASVVPTGVYAASSDWGHGDQAEALAGRIERAGGQLARTILTSVRPAAVDGYENVVPFGEMFGRSAS